MSDHPDRHCGAGQREPRRTVRRGGLVWGRCMLGRWGWFVCVRSQSRPSSTHLRKCHAEWRRLGGTCRGLAGPRHPLYVRVPGKVSRRFRSSVDVSHGLPLYPFVVRGDLSHGIGQSVPDTLCRHKAPNPFAGGFTNPWEILPQISVIARPCVSAIMPLCKLGGACDGKRHAESPGYIRRPMATCRPSVRRFQGQCNSTTATLRFSMRQRQHLRRDTGDHASESGLKPIWHLERAGPHSRSARRQSSAIELGSALQRGHAPRRRSSHGRRLSGDTPAACDEPRLGERSDLGNMQRDLHMRGCSKVGESRCPSRAHPT